MAALGSRTFSPSISDTICTRIADGESLRAICASDDIPARSTVIGWLEDNVEFRTKYARARQLQADAAEERLQDIAERTLKGEYDPAAARVAVMALQWRASKLAPKKYGDQISVDHSGSMDVCLKIGGVMAAKSSPDANANG